jgi:hypothetical protein
MSRESWRINEAMMGIKYYVLFRSACTDRNITRNSLHIADFRIKNTVMVFK